MMPATAAEHVDHFAILSKAKIIKLFSLLSLTLCINKLDCS